MYAPLKVAHVAQGLDINIVRKLEPESRSNKSNYLLPTIWILSEAFLMNLSFTFLLVLWYQR